MQSHRYLLLLAPLATAVPVLAAAQTDPSAVPGATATAPATVVPPQSPAAEPDHAATAPDPNVSTITLEQAYARLQADNLDLAAARVRAEQAAAVAQEAGAPLRPTLLGTGSYVRNNKEVSLRVGSFLAQIPGAPNVPDIVIQPLDAWTAAGTLRVPLFAPTAWHDSDAADAGERAARGATVVAQQQARAGLAQLAYGALALEEVVSAAGRAIDLADQQVKSAQRRVQAGTAAPLDVLRAQAELVRREGDLARARADLERAQLAMGVLLGKAERVRVTAPIETSAEPPKVSTEAAFEHRAELKVVEAQQAAGESMRKSANSRFLPQLSATGSIFASDEPYPTGDKTGWRVAVELTIPLYDGGFRYGKRREADAAIALANTQAAQKRLQIRQEIADAEREIRVADERLRLAETRAQLARDAAASAQRSFTVGLTSSLDVLDANDKLFQAEVALAAERAKKAQARIELARARGTL